MCFSPNANRKIISVTVSSQVFILFSMVDFRSTKDLTDSPMTLHVYVT